MNNLSNSLFGFMFYRIPCHFNKSIKRCYIEHFYFKHENIYGVFDYKHINNNIFSEITIGSYLDSFKLVEKYNYINKNESIVIEQNLHNKVEMINFKDIPIDILKLLNLKTDNNIKYCTCCNTFYNHIM